MGLFEFGCRRAYKRAQGSLGRAVNAETGSTLYARDRTNKDDAAAVNQQRQGFLHSENCAVQIDVKEFVEMLFCLFVEGNELSNTRVGNYNVDSPFCSANGLVQTIQVSPLGNVALDASDIVADCLNRLVQFSLATSGNENIGAFFDEEFCDSQANPLGRSRDDCNFLSQVAHILPLRETGKFLVQQLIGASGH